MKRSISSGVSIAPFPTPFWSTKLEKEFFMSPIILFIDNSAIAFMHAGTDKLATQKNDGGNNDKLVTFC